MRRVGTDKMCCEIDWCDWIIGKASPFLENWGFMCLIKDKWMMVLLFNGKLKKQWVINKYFVSGSKRELGWNIVSFFDIMSESNANFQIFE